MAQRARSRLSGRESAVASALPRLCRRSRGERHLPGQGGRRRPAHARPSRDSRLDVHDPGRLEPRARDRRHGVRDLALRLGADAGRATEPRRAPLTPELRLRLVLAPRVVLSDPAPRHRLRRDRAGRLDPRTRERVSRARPAGVHGRADARSLVSHGRPLAGRRMGVAPRDDLVHARGVPDRPVAPQRLPRPGRREPLDTRPRQPGRCRHPAGTTRLHPAWKRTHARLCSPSASA